MRTVLKEFEFLSSFKFRYHKKCLKLSIDHSKRFNVSIFGKKKAPAFINLDLAIEFIEDHCQKS